MPTIGLVDDRKRMRTSMKTSINIALRQLGVEWNVIAIPPFESKPDNYYEWIRNNDICVLLIDERLNELPDDDDEIIDQGDFAEAVDYTGHELIQELRLKEKELPIIAITSYSADEDLQNNLSFFDNIVDRTHFNKMPKKYVERFLRFGQKFIDRYSKEIFRISELSTLIAKGEYTEDDKNELTLLQSKLNLYNVEKSDIPRSEWLNNFDNAIQDMEDLKNIILKHLNS